MLILMSKVSFILADCSVNDTLVKVMPFLNSFFRMINVTNLAVPGTLALAKYSTIA